VEALEWIKTEVDAMQTEIEHAGALLIPGEPYAVRLAQVSAVVSAIRVLYGHDERGTR